jgi:magnesium transporter
VWTIRHVTEEGAVRITTDDVATARAGAGFVWVDLTAADLADTSLLYDLGLPDLVVEDMRDDRHLPKVEHVGELLSLTVHGLDVRSLEDEPRTLELDCALTADLLVTWHDGGLASVAAVGEGLDGGMLGFARPFLLLHRILDVMNDVLLPFVDHLDRRLDVIEEDILDEPTEQTRLELYLLQRDVIQLRRVVLPQTEVVRRLGRDRAPGWQDGDESLVRDLLDHLTRMVAMCDSYQQLLESATASYRSALDDRLNDMLATLTIVSAVLLPVSVVAGLWGMNFVVIPGAEQPDGFWYLLAGLGGLVVLLLLWFTARGWIGRRAERRAARRRHGLDAVLEVPVLGRVHRVPVHGGRVAGRAARRATRRG